MVMPRSGQVITSADIVEDLLEKIINLKYMPGELISEADLCTAYDTTRHTVRGALAVLKERGFVEVFPQRGTFVSLIDLSYIDDILFLREAIEQETVYRIIENGAGEDLIAALKECLEQQKALDHSKDDPEKFFALDFEFHELLLSAIGRPNLMALYGDELLHVRRWRNIEVASMKRISDLPGEHQKIIDAIEMKDVEAARDILNMHIDSVARYGDEMKKNYPEYFV